MNRLLLIATAVLALVLCGMARANYQYGNGIDDRFDRKSNDLRHFDDRPFDRDLFNRAWYDLRHFGDQWFDHDRDDLHYYDDHPFRHDLNDLRYFDTRVIAYSPRAEGATTAQTSVPTLHDAFCLA